MSSRQRIVLLVIAAVILAGGIVLAAGSGDDEPDEPAETTATTTPRESEPGGGGSENGETQEREPPKPRVETIRMRGRAPVGEPKTLKYERGDTIRLRFVSDVKEEVHIHGFDTYVQVPSKGAAVTNFKANLEGIFEVESHGSGELLAKLEIRPK